MQKLTVAFHQSDILVTLMKGGFSFYFKQKNGQQKADHFKLFE